MRPPRGLLILAIVAALWGAPSSVSAAVNELSSPQVSPTNGSVTTAFAFRVRYDGGFPAVLVNVTVAGRTIPMSLESGSLTAGWWTGSSLLPVGAWSTTFDATAAKGPSASIAGPPVIVNGPATPSATAGGATAPGSGPTPESAPVSSPHGATPAPAAPAQAPDEAQPGASSTAMVRAQPAASGSDPADVPSTGSAEQPEHGSSAMPGSGGDADEALDAPGGMLAPAAAGSGGPAPIGDATGFRPASATEPRHGTAAADELVSGVLLIGLAGVASVAIIGTLLLVARRRRAPDRVPAMPAPSFADDEIMRRVARSGRGRPTHDPIVAALGVDDEMAARRAIRRAGGPNRGGGETRPAGRPEKR